MCIIHQSMFASISILHIRIRGYTRSFVAEVYSKKSPAAAVIISPILKCCLCLYNLTITVKSIRVITFQLNDHHLLFQTLSTHSILYKQSESSRCSSLIKNEVSLCFIVVLAIVSAVEDNVRELHLFIWRCRCCTSPGKTMLVR